MRSSRFLHGPFPYLFAALLPLLLAAGECSSLQPTLSSIYDEVFSSSCAFESCHGAAGGQNGLDLGSKDGAYATLVGIDGEDADVVRVVPGDPDNSLLYQVLLVAVDEVRQMPVGDQLPDDEIEAIRQWIEDGALDN